MIEAATRFSYMDPSHRDFDPSSSHGILTVDFEREEFVGAIDTLAFKPTQAPFSFVINGHSRVDIDEILVEGIMTQCLAPSAYYDPLLDVCFLRLGVLDLGRYAECRFKKLE